MKEFNCFKLLKFPNVQMMGFKEVKGFIYVSISRVSPLIVVYNKILNFQGLIQHIGVGSFSK